MAKIKLKLLASYNKDIKLVGYLSNWEDISMEKDKPGYFQTEVNLEDEVYQYKFREW